MNEIQIKEEEIYHNYEKDTIREKYSLEEPKEIKATNMSAIKLCSASKKISKKKLIDGQNAERFEEFFKKWRLLKKSDTLVKKHTKFWYSNFNKKRNTTYIYRNFSDEIKIHVRLAINEKIFDFHKLTESDWRKLFCKLTEYLNKEKSTLESLISEEDSPNVVSVWIDSLDTFRIDAKPKRSKEPAFQDSNLEKEHNNEIDAECVAKEPRKKRKKSNSPKENRAVVVDKKSSIPRKVCLPDDKKDSEDSKGKSTSSILVKKTSFEEKHTRVDEMIAESPKEYLKKPSSFHHKKIDHSEKLREQKESCEARKELCEGRKEIQVLNLNQEILVRIPGDSIQKKHAWILAAQDKVTNHDETMLLLRREKVEIQEQNLVKTISCLISNIRSSERQNEEILQELEQIVTTSKKPRKTAND